MLRILEKISPSEIVSNGYISNHNKVRRPRPKFKVSFFPPVVFIYKKDSHNYTFFKFILVIFDSSTENLKWSSFKDNIHKAMRTYVRIHESGVIYLVILTWSPTIRFITSD